MNNNYMTALLFPNCHKVISVLTRDQDRKLLTALKRQAVVSPFLGSDVTRLRDTGAAVGHKVEDVATTVLPGNGR